MKSCLRSKRVPEWQLRQICLLHFAFSQLVTAYENAQVIFAEARSGELDEGEKKQLEKDEFLLTFLVKEMGRKLSPYRGYAETAARVFTKIAKGLKNENISNLEMFAATMVHYWELPGQKVVHFSNVFKNYVYAIDMDAFDQVGGRHIEAAAKLSHQIAERFMNGDYLEFKGAA